MQTRAKADISIGTDIMVAFTRIPVETDQLMREFIDNSTTSFYDHENALSAIVEQGKCVVSIEWDDSQIVIIDNANGMVEEEFLRALKPNAKAKQYSEGARGKYGLGLKYAALNLGNWYSIETTALGSDKLFYAEMDLDELKQNITEVDYTISDSSTSKHYTKIVIKKLERTLKEIKKKKTEETKEESLRRSLSQIYQYDIIERGLSLFLNGTKIIYNDPEFLQKKDGGEFFSTFDDCFDFKGKEYSFHGWLAILKTGNVSNAGFKLVQKSRAIQLNYRPLDLFGQPNDFRYQRVVGEISLDGENWIVTFTKDAVKWDDYGLQDIFIQCLKDNESISEIFRYAKTYRKGNENITQETLRGWGSSLKKDFSKISSKTSELIENQRYDKKSVSLEMDSTKRVEKDKNRNSDEETILRDNNEGYTLPILYAGVAYEFEIIPTDDVGSDAPWIRTEIKDADKNTYRVYVNVRTPFFFDYKDVKSKKLITKMAICVSLAQVSSKRRGLNTIDSQRFIEELNCILASEDKED